MQRPTSPPSPTPRSVLKSDEASHWFITDLTVELPQPPPPSASASSRLPPPTRSRWRTKEFCVYYAVFLVVVPCMVSVAVQLSKESHPNYSHFSHRLKKGWIFGWSVDTSDHQWNVFRTNLPLLSLLVLLWATLQHFSPRFLSTPTALDSRATFILSFAIPLLTLLHGTSFPKMIGILWINFQISKLSKEGRSPMVRKAAPFLGWAFNLAVLFANEVWDGYRWGSISQSLAVLDTEWMKGILPRWHINWNITMLRLISYNMDHHWSCTSSPAPAPLPSEKLLAPPTDRTRVSTSHPSSLYTFRLYLTYALYPPLYLAGPLLTYNSFISQLVVPPTIPRRTVVGYAMRWVTCLLTMELVLHSMYVVAIKDESRRGAWMGDTPFQLSMIGFWNLIVVWLKLLIPWRFFRLWSLVDGIDPPENMVRCMANNYSTSGFWRSWHRSYNLWIVRYLYVPIGGKTHAAWATLVVFTFVALWHDLSLKLLTWGWVISLFVLPEMAARKFVPYEKYGKEWWYRHLAAFGGVLNVLMMMSANLIGFAIGTEGMSYMWGQMIGSWEGIKFMFVVFGCLFVAVQIMFEYREEERRRGIVRKF